MGVRGAGVEGVAAARVAAPAVPDVEDEVVAQVDAEDHEIGSVLRRDLGRLGANYRVVHVLLFTSKGGLVLQRLPAEHPTHPRGWGSSTAGHVRAGETYEVAALRELEEELGVRGVPLVWLGKTQVQERTATKFVGVFQGLYDGPLTLDGSEVEAVRVTSLAEARASSDVTPTFKAVLRLYDASV